MIQQILAGIFAGEQTIEITILVIFIVLFWWFAKRNDKKDKEQKKDSLFEETKE